MHASLSDIIADVAANSIEARASRVDVSVVEEGGVITLSVKDNMESKAMLAPMILYLLINSTMNLFALLQLMSHNNLGGWLTFIGAILFFVSDCSLFIVRYSDRPNIIYKKHFTVMLTYLLGEFLIVLGILQILG